MSDLSAEVMKARIRIAKVEAQHDLLSDLLNRIEQRRQQLGLSERRTAIKARLSPSQIRTMRRQWREGKQRGVTTRPVVSLAQALHTTPEWLISGTGPEEVIAKGQQGPGATAGLRLVGAVGAGLWLESASENNDAQLTAVPVDPRFPAEYQSAYEVRGP